MSIYVHYFYSNKYYRELFFTDAHSWYLFVSYFKKGNFLISYFMLNTITVFSWVRTLGAPILPFKFLPFLKRFFFINYMIYS